MRIARIVLQIWFIIRAYFLDSFNLFNFAAK